MAGNKAGGRGKVATRAKSARKRVDSVDRPTRGKRSRRAHQGIGQGSGAEDLAALAVF